MRRTTSAFGVQVKLRLGGSCCGYSGLRWVSHCDYAEPMAGVFSDGLYCLAGKSTRQRVGMLQTAE